MSKNKSRVRSRNLTDGDIATVVEILDGWSGKLTWETLIDALVKHLRARYTRQALHQHERIRMAFHVTKKRLRVGTDERDLSRLSQSELKIFAGRYESLVAQVKRLEEENYRLLEQFAVWAYNAHIAGLDAAFLSRPMPKVNRDQTREARIR